jgi:hypothetical protein
LIQIFRLRPSAVPAVGVILLENFEPRAESRLITDLKIHPPAIQIQKKTLEDSVLNGKAVLTPE